MFRATKNRVLFFNVYNLENSEKLRKKLSLFVIFMCYLMKKKTKSVNKKKVMTDIKKNHDNPPHSPLIIKQKRRSRIAPYNGRPFFKHLFDKCESHDKNNDNQ